MILRFSRGGSGIIARLALLVASLPVLVGHKWDPVSGDARIAIKMSDPITHNDMRDTKILTTSGRVFTRSDVIHHV